MFDNKHAEEASPLTSVVNSWYLPIFDVYHPKKKNQLRLVFDSSAKYMDLSLNKVLMSGPDLNNSLLGVLMRFRREPVAVSSDIQQRICFTSSTSGKKTVTFCDSSGFRTMTLIYP